MYKQNNTVAVCTQHSVTVVLATTTRDSVPYTHATRFTLTRTTISLGGITLSLNCLSLSPVFDCMRVCAVCCVCCLYRCLFCAFFVIFILHEKLVPRKDHQKEEEEKPKILPDSPKRFNFVVVFFPLLNTTLSLHPKKTQNISNCVCQCLTYVFLVTNIFLLYEKLLKNV